MVSFFKPKLHYFNLQGRAEQIRLILNHAKVEFEDNRFNFKKWQELKQQEPFLKFGAVPLLEIDGRVMNESNAIAKYFATKHGYYPADIESAYEVDVVTNQVDDCMNIAAQVFWVLKGDERNKALENLRETSARKLYRLLSERIEANENKNYLIGDRITLADFRVFSFYLIAVREFEPEVLGSLLAEFPNLLRYLNWQKHHEFNSYIRRCRDTEFGITNEERKVIDQIYDYWFEIQDLNPVGLDTQPLMKRWYMGGEQVDNECRAFQEHIEKAKTGQYDHWAKEPYGRLALILLLDQFTRNSFRKSAEAFSGDMKAQSLTLDAIEKGWFWLYSHLERMFFLMPLMHAEDKNLADLSLELITKHTELANKVYPGLVKGEGQIPFAIQHRDIIVKFGRYPYRNEVLGRETTPEEEEYLKDGARFGQ